MPLDVPLLRRSFALVLERDPEPTRRFYDVLFTRHPEAKPLFRLRHRRSQEQMLAVALTSVLDHLDDAVWLDEHLGALGARHVRYGVTAAMYGWVGDALLTTLSEIAGADWTRAHEAQWSAAYQAIVELMRRGEARAAAGPQIQTSPPGPLSLTGEGEKSLQDKPFRLLPSPVREREGWGG